MKANRTNSFRLHRVSRASSLKKQSVTQYEPKQFFKLSSINSVTRGVKHADLSFLTGNDLNKLRKEPLDNEDGHYEAAHANLAEVRKKYDDMKKQRTHKDEAIYRLKEDIKKYKIFENEYQSKINKATSEAERMTTELHDKKNLLEETSMQKKVLLNMRERLKWDKVVYDQRKFNLEKQQSFLEKQQMAFKKDGHEMDESTDRTMKIYRKLEKQLEAERIEREEHINNLLMMIEKKQNLNSENIYREREIMEIAERAMQDKDPNQKQWHKIYLTHAFLSKMLRNKIDREMEKFTVVQLAFKTIKTATGISDAQTLVYKYLNKEAVYGDLLGRITANEKRIAELKEETDRLNRQEKELEIERETIQNIKLKTIDISNETKELNHFEEKKKSMETYESKICQWIGKQFRKFNLIEKTEENVSIIKERTQIVTAFKRYIQIVNESLKKCEKDYESQETTEAGDLTARDSARVTRVMPKKSRKNSAGQQIFDLGEEEVPANFDVEEGELIDNQREEMIKTNSKFMQEARKRYEERRKLMLQKDAGKKQKKAPEVKKEDD